MWIYVIKIPNKTGMAKKQISWLFWDLLPWTQVFWLIGHNWPQLHLNNKGGGAVQNNWGVAIFFIFLDMANQWQNRPSGADSVKKGFRKLRLFWVFFLLTRNKYFGSVLTVVYKIYLIKIYFSLEIDKF